MIHIVEGVPGSGKSYYAVHYLISNFYDFDDFYNEYKEKGNKNVLVITNIENFKPKHLNLDFLLDRYPIENFFTVENFERIQKQYRVKNIVVIIDEAQRYFDKKFFDKNVLYFFQYHRHLGIDIFLVTQSHNTIAKELVVLAEYIVKAIPRSRQMGTFRYKFYDVEGNLLFQKSLKKSKDVFNAYKSMQVEEITKPKNAILPKVLVGIGALCFGVFGTIYGIRWGFYSMLDGKNQVSVTSNEKKQKNKLQHKEADNKDEVNKIIKYVSSYGYPIDYVKKTFQNYYCVNDICYPIENFSSETEEEE